MPETARVPGANGSAALGDQKNVQIVRDRGEKQHRAENARLTKRKAIAVASIPGSNNPRRLGVIEEVGRKLDKAHQRSSLFSSDNSFISRSKFDEIITPEVVLDIVSDLDSFKHESPKTRNKLAQDIYYGDGVQGPRRRLLGVLLGIDRVGDLKQHMEDGITDDCLPLTTEPGPDGEEECMLYCERHGRNHMVIEQYPRPDTRRQFSRWSRILMPTFIISKRNAKHNHYVLERGDPLPMTVPDVSLAVNASSAAMCQGGFGEVIPVRIDASGGKFEHHTLLNPKQLFALKRLKHEFGEDAEKHRNEFEMEVRSLLYADNRADCHGRVDGKKESNDVHLIPLLATFEVWDPQSNLRTYYLLFDWAEGNLKDFWKSNTNMIRDKASLPWLAEQFYQLVRALHIMHNDRQFILSNKTESNLFGRHGDIKPSNFLYFELADGRKIFVIGDFGLGRLHSKMSRSKQDPKDIPMTATYRAPEFDLENGTISPRSDLFSMGCVFLEHITWFFYGNQGVDEFSAARLETGAKYGFEEDTFFALSSDHRTAGLKGKVKDWIDTRLRCHPDCSEYLYKMLDLIEHGMLHPDSEKRLKSEMLRKDLATLCQLCSHSESFYTDHWKETLQ